MARAVCQEGFHRLFASAAAKTKKGAAMTPKKNKQLDVETKKILKMYNSFGDGSAGVSPLTPEEQEELRTLAKRYNVETSKQHHKEMQDMQLKIDLLHEALDALPAEEQEFARKPDTSPVPMHRPMIVDNPPLRTRVPRGNGECEKVTFGMVLFGDREFLMIGPSEFLFEIRRCLPNRNWLYLET